MKFRLIKKMSKRSISHVDTIEKDASPSQFTIPVVYIPKSFTKDDSLVYKEKKCTSPTTQKKKFFIINTLKKS